MSSNPPSRMAAEPCGMTQVSPMRNLKKKQRTRLAGLRCRLLILAGIALAPSAALLSLHCTEQRADIKMALAFYHENKLEQARPLLERIVDEHQDDASARAWLAETYRRLGMKGAAVRTAEEALQRDPCSSFAHTVLADACRRPPGDTMRSDSDTTWVHLCRAVECDSTDGNAWTSIWGEAVLREKFDLMHEIAVTVDMSFYKQVAVSYTHLRAHET